MPTPFPLLLASQSPRRAQLLSEAGIAFEQRSPPFADPDQPPDHLRGHQAEDYAETLAVHKAHSLADTLAEIDGPALILAADTICVDAEGNLVGKPADRAHARAMLSGFASSSHRVISGVALLTLDGAGGRSVQSFADVATVGFGAVSAGQIEAYVAGDQWRDKAGGYNLLDRQAAGWPITVEGDPTTVMGLPMGRLGPLLNAEVGGR